MKKYYYLLLILPFLISASCNNDKLICKEDEFVEAPNEFLQYWYFPKGSYWIYQLQDTVGVYDTLRVVNDEKRYCNRGQSNDPDCDQEPCVWIYTNTWEHSNDNYFRVGGGCPEKGKNYLTSYDFDSYWIVQSGARCFPSYVAEYPIKYPFIIGEKYMGMNQIISEDTVYTTNSFFPKTVHIRPDYGTAIDSLQAYYVKDMYICPSVGVVKWHYSHSGTWELISYNIKH